MSRIRKRATIVPSHITVQIDTREKYPIPFPRNIRIADPDVQFRTRLIPVRTEKAKLDKGDYRLKEFPDDCVIERKGSPLEIYKNFFDKKDQIRSAKAFRRLSTVKFPYLLLEMTPANLTSPSLSRIAPYYNAEKMMHRLSLVISKYGLNVMWVPKSNSTKVRRVTGQMLLHLMLGYALRELTQVPLNLDNLNSVVPDYCVTAGKLPEMGGSR
ncbi:MAG TPA: hypothetical protein ENI23_02865 [bacterium]|nr:hypothetical protein [bacterium]